jgi:2',3'-cyclic-nucleotide 2'-phosphodiesterase
MKILVIGDIVGRPGRKAVKFFVPNLIKEKKLDLVIANGENAAGGSGLTPAITDEILSCGIDVITSGDHIWKKKEIADYIDKEDRLLRPANYPEGVPGEGCTILNIKDNIKVAVINIIGTVFMKPLESPFKIINQILEKMEKEISLVIVDFHAEATSEKIAMGWFLDGRVSCVFGTHTHIQTADERILPKKTAYITDLGMTGAVDSVLGRKTERVLEHFLTGMPARFEMADKNVQLQGAIVDIDQETGRAKSIERINLRLEDEK